MFNQMEYHVGMAIANTALTEIEYLCEARREFGPDFERKIANELEHFDGGLQRAFQ
jgi:hypothetical protein